MTKLADTDSDPVNDSGTGRDGTRVDETWYNAFVTAIDALIHSTNNPTITPADTIDEVVDARGSIGTLDGRIDVEHNEDGTHKNTGIIATFITEAQLMGGLGGVNLIRNDDFLSWPDGDSAAPVYWALTGAGASVARTGTGLGDTNRKIGDFAGKVTRAGTNCYLENILLDGTAFTRADFLRTKYIAIGVWVKCSTPNIARVAVYDGIGTSYSSYHTGGGAWEFLPITRQLDSSATEISVQCHVDTSDGNAHFSGATAILVNNDMDLIQYQASPVIYGALHFSIGGDLTAGSNQGRMVMARGGIVKDVQCLAKTAPTGADAIFDVNTYDGASYTSMFSAGARPKILDAASPPVGGSQPDDTYARRCVRGAYGASIGAGSVVTLDVDQIGSGTAGADAVVEVRTLQYASPLERFLNHDD
jgi:hypothetical protein